MGVDRFFCPEFQVGQPARIEGDEARHLARVRRVPLGAEVEIFDGCGKAAVATVVGLSRDRVDLRVERLGQDAAAAFVSLTLAVAIPKGDRFDWLIEKATELGVERVVPVMTERSTVDPRSAKLDRLRRAVIESCKQCRRNRLMVIEAPVSWESWSSTPRRGNVHRWIAHPGGRMSWGTDRLDPEEAIIVAVGPEGGFSERELDRAHTNGWEPIHLTGTTLRVETAALAAAASILIRGESKDRVL